jgi:protein SCO1/2
MRHTTLLACGLALAVAAAARADDNLPSILTEVGIDQRISQPVPLELPFRDEAGNTVTLGDCTDGKPTILVLAYYRCPMLCTQVLNGVLEAARGIPFELGKDYHIVTVSFDERERPELAAAKKASYLEEYGRPGGDRGWRFLTGPQESIVRLANAVGFHYRYDPKQDQFAHASCITILTSQGKVARYFLGIRYPAGDVRLSLVEASENKVGRPIDQLLLYCYHYDPDTGKYTPVVMNVMRLGGVVTLLALGGLLGGFWARERRRAAATQARSASEGTQARSASEG